MILCCCSYSCSYDIMLSCWNESPLQRPPFTKLRATIDSMLLADSKGDYLDFSQDVLLTRPFRHSQFVDVSDRTSICTSSPLHFPDVHQTPVGVCQEEGCTELPESTFKLLLNTTLDQLDGECTLTQSSSGQSIFLGKDSVSPEHNGRSHTSSKNKLNAQQTLSQQEQSPKSYHSPSRFLTVDQRSLDTHSNCSRLSFLSNQTREEEEAEQVGGGTLCSSDRPRPMSLFLSRERDRVKVESSDRYVKEPTKMMNLNVTTDTGVFGGMVNGRTSGTGSGEMGVASRRVGAVSRGVGMASAETGGENSRSNCDVIGGNGPLSGGGSRSEVTTAINKGREEDRVRLQEDVREDVLEFLIPDQDYGRHFRRHSDGMLGTNRDGYVTILELQPIPVDPYQSNAPPTELDLPEIQITITEDL